MLLLVLISIFLSTDFGVKIASCSMTLLTLGGTIRIFANFNRVANVVKSYNSKGIFLSFRNEIG